jgi:hypothetical protein
MMNELLPGVLILLLTIGVIFLISESKDAKEQNRRKK